MAMLSPTPLYIKMEPNKELRFSGDFRESVVEGLTLRNPGKVPLLFKVLFRIKYLLKKNMHAVLTI